MCHLSMCLCDQAFNSKGFSKDMWLEAVNPLRRSEICVARITQVKGRLLWLRLEGRNEWSVCVSPRLVCLTVNFTVHDHHLHLVSCLSIGLTKPLPDCIVDVDSMDIFPVGWCEANSYPLIPLLKPVCECNRCISVIIYNMCFVLIKSACLSNDLLSMFSTQMGLCCKSFIINLFWGINHCVV